MAAPPLRWGLLLVIALAALGTGQRAWAMFKDSHGDQIDVISQLGSNNPLITVWRIDRPNIAKPASSYPDIKFLPGDRFKVLAAGCDQTGGHGQTWKLYVNPQGDNTDHLYHGLIAVDEAVPRTRPDPNSPNSTMQKLSRLSDFGVGDGRGKGEPVEHSIPNPLPTGRDISKDPIVLNLGFEDDGYGDNGYYSRDSGNNDQCVNVPDAYVIVTIAHQGAAPPNPENYVGIAPNAFECRAAWAFKNEGTPELSYASFQTAFQITWAGKYLNPFNEILFLTQKGIASGGNCEGMSLLALAGEDQFVVGDLKEDFWHNYSYKDFPQTPPNIQFDVNVAQWQQLSGYFVHNWLNTIFSNATSVTTQIEHDLTSSQNNYNYGLLTLKHGGSGHVLVPLAITHSGNHTYIQVYDSNRPCGGIPNTANNPNVDVVGDDWSYVMAGNGGTWTGKNGIGGLTGNGMGYIPYHGPDDGWTSQVSSLSGLATAVFGTDVSVDQVTDSKGRTLIANGVLNTTDQGLGRSVVLLPTYAASAEPAKRPRSGDKTKVLRVEREGEGTSAQRAALAQIDKEYADDYARSGSVYVITDPSLAELTFSLSSKKAGSPVRAVINQGEKFFEVRSVAAAGTAQIHPKLTVHSLTDLAGGGLTVSSSGAEVLKVAISHGRYDDQAKKETVQQTSEIATTKGFKARVKNDDLELFTADASVEAVVSKHIMTADAKVTEMPPRRLTPANMQ